jgi:hypothetical protein
MYRAALLFVAVVLTLGVVAPAEAAAPRLIMVSGEPLTNPILISEAAGVELVRNFLEGLVGLAR